MIFPTTTVRSAIVASITDFEHVNVQLDVIGTNLLLALIVMFVIGLTSALFNATLDENRAEIEGWFARPAAGIASIGRVLSSLAPSANRVPRSPRAVAVGRLTAVLLVTALIYGFLSPDFGVDGRSAIVFVSLLIGLGLVTYLAEGGSVLFSTRRLHVPAGVRIYGAALTIAIGCVVLSRLIDFKPGVLYGFVASAVLIAGVSLGRRQRAEIVAIPMVALLTVSLIAWLLLVPLRAAGLGEESWILGLLETTAAIVFVAGLESVFFNMIPIQFMDGATIASWSRVAWAVLFGLSGFLFWHLLLNQNKSSLEAFRDTKVVAALGLVALYSIVTMAVWGYFHVRANRRTHPEDA